MLMILEDMINRLTEGSSLADAMSHHMYFFHQDEIELLRSTEITGNMAQTLEQIADNLEESQTINQKIKKALTYPTMVICFAVVAVIVLLVFVMPTIVEMYEGIELPGITQFMLDLSDFLKAHGITLAIGVVVAVVLYNFLYANVLVVKILVDGLLLKVPKVNEVIRYFYMSRFTTLLSQFYAAGVSPVISFKLLADIFDNFMYKRRMIEVRNSINAGFSLYDSME